MKEIINEKINLMKEVQNLQTKLQQQDLIILREIDSSLNIINSLSKDRQDLKLRIQERERRIEEIKNNFGTSKEINLEQLK
ncbi:MAG: hypothetical protein IT267_07140 [Saprospiraceae bacterium]|nr:hypothetical protein [Saprospiraceae bacterium]